MILSSHIHNPYTGLILKNKHLGFYVPQVEHFLGLIFFIILNSKVSKHYMLSLLEKIVCLKHQIHQLKVFFSEKKLNTPLINCFTAARE